MHAVTMAQPSPCASPCTRRRSDGSVRECLFFPVLERNEQERLEALVRRRAGGAADKRGRGAGEGWGGQAALQGVWEELRQSKRPEHALQNARDGLHQRQERRGEKLNGPWQKCRFRSALDEARECKVPFICPGPRVGGTPCVLS